MHPTVQEILDWQAAVDQFQIDAKTWSDNAIKALQNNQAIGSNPPTPPPPPPGY